MFSNLPKFESEDCQVRTRKWPIDEVFHFIAATRSENSQWAQTTEKETNYCRGNYS